jgi:hypothetical protein
MICLDRRVVLHWKHTMVHLLLTKLVLSRKFVTVYSGWSSLVGSIERGNEPSSSTQVKRVSTSGVIVDVSGRTRLIIKSGRTPKYVLDMQNIHVFPTIMHLIRDKCKVIAVFI